MKTLLLLSLAVAATALVSNCETSPTGSNPVSPHSSTTPTSSDPGSPQSSVILTLRLSDSEGGPDHPITASGTAHNPGANIALYLAGCGDNTGVYYEVLGPDGKSVHIFDPTAPRPLCPEVETEMQPGADVQTSLEFSGILYSGEGVRLTAPAGRYTVVARFLTWTHADHSDEVILEARESFLWVSEN